MITEDLEVSFNDFRREINYTHEIWKDEVWNFIYNEHLADLGKIIPSLINNISEMEAFLKQKQKEIHSI